MLEISVRLTFTWHLWNHFEVRDAWHANWHWRKSPERVMFSPTAHERPKQLFFLPLTRMLSNSSFCCGICVWMEGPGHRWVIKSICLVDSTLFLGWPLGNAIGQGFRAALGMSPTKIFHSNHHYGESKWWLKCKSGRLKPQVSFWMLQAPPSSHSYSNTVALRVFSRALTDAKASNMSFRTFMHHLPFSRTLTIIQVLWTFASRPFLSSVFKLGSASQGLFLIYPSCCS